MRLLYSEQGLCEVKGMIHCSLVDIRYHQYADHTDSESMRFGDYLALGCDVLFFGVGD